MTVGKTSDYRYKSIRGIIKWQTCVFRLENSSDFNPKVWHVDLSNRKCQIDGRPPVIRIVRDQSSGLVRVNESICQ